MTDLAANAARRLTWSEFADIDDGDEMKGVELVDGLLEEGEVPTRKHGRIVTRLIMMLGDWLDGHGGGELLSQDNRVRIALRRVRKPDILLVTATDSPRFEKDTLVSPPTLLIEVITKRPRDERCDRVEKLADYEAIGARQYWLIDPELERLEIYALGEDGLYGPPRVYGAHDVVDGGEIGFEGLRFVVSDLAK